MRTEPGTVASQAMTTAKRKVGRLSEDAKLMEAMDACAETLARDELEPAIASMSQIIPLLPLQDESETIALILNECGLRLEEFGTGRMEYLLLALHAMDEAWQKKA
jgi:hypothetical protein